MDDTERRRSDGGEGVAQSWTSRPRNATAEHNSWSSFLRHPTDTDASDMQALVAGTGILDVNSTYAYLLLASDFAETCIIARRDDEVCGLVTGYHPPSRPEVLFVWQVAVAERARGTGLAVTMLDELVRRVRDARQGHPITVETTVAPTNVPSRALFGAFARRHGVPLVEKPRFAAAQFGSDGAHEDEPTLRIGPILAAVPG
ncbi:diaminobutyrate acetyltransferase [Mycolicibacterium tokaiense]|nr:diaminobutyrate acetyltransferase [Mycolicibacterium tokaiense]